VNLKYVGTDTPLPPPIEEKPKESEAESLEKKVQERNELLEGASPKSLVKPVMEEEPQDPEETKVV
jgi:hypothetical protein